MDVYFDSCPAPGGWSHTYSWPFWSHRQAPNDQGCGGQSACPFKRNMLYWFSTSSSNVMGFTDYLLGFSSLTLRTLRFWWLQSREAFLVRIEPLRCRHTPCSEPSCSGTRNRGCFPMVFLRWFPQYRIGHSRMGQSWRNWSGSQVWE